MDFLNFCYSFILRPLFSIVFSFYKVSIAGAENIPKIGPFIVAANHRSFLDAPFIAWSMYPRPVNWIVAKWVYSAWYFRPFCRISRSVPINGSSRRAEGVLNKGGIIGIFPEGCICCDSVVKKGHRGVVVLALHTGAPVLPCYIDGAFYKSEKDRNVLAPQVLKPLRLIIGKPIFFDKFPHDRIPLGVLNKTLPEIIGAINGLKPEEMK